MKTAVKLKVEPSNYNGFNLVELIDKVRRANNAARQKGKELPYRGFYIPQIWQDVEDWFWVTKITQCIRRAGYEALGEKGLPIEDAQFVRMRASASDHRDLEREFRIISLANEIYLLDPESGLIGKIDLLGLNYLTGELIIGDFKIIEQWHFQTAIKRKRLRAHLKKTPFYAPLPEDELQLIVYIYLFKKMFGLSIRFGLLVYVNRNKPEERKPALVEYDEKLLEKFLAKLDLQRQLLKEKKLIEPYLSVESYIHTRCPYRLKCPRGQEAMRTKVKKKSIPLWKIYQLRRQKQQVPPLEPEQKRLF